MSSFLLTADRDCEGFFFSLCQWEPSYKLLPQSTRTIYSLFLLTFPSEHNFRYSYSYWNRIECFKLQDCYSCKIPATSSVLQKIFTWYSSAAEGITAQSQVAYVLWLCILINTVWQKPKWKHIFLKPSVLTDICNNKENKGFKCCYAVLNLRGTSYSFFLFWDALNLFHLEIA